MTITPPDHCPLCRHPLDVAAPLHIDTRRGIVLSGGRAIRLSTFRMRVFRELLAVSPDFITTDALAAQLYGAAERANAEKSLRVIIHDMKPDVEHLNYRIEGVSKLGYRLVPK